MSPHVTALILGSVALSSVAQLALKVGVSSPHVQAALASGSRAGAAAALLGECRVLLGLGLYAVGALSWLIVLARADVSYAYPFMGLGFLLTTLLAWLVLGEPVGPARVLGTVLVVLGVWLIGTTT